MERRLRIVPEVAAWLAGLAARDPAAARRAGAAVLALLDQGPGLGPPLVTPVAPLAGLAAGRREPDPREALDYAYRELLAGLTVWRRRVADAATRRTRVELQLSESGPAAPEAEKAELTRRLAELTEVEKKLTAASQRLQSKVGAFRSQKETVKAAYTAAAAARRVNEAWALVSGELGGAGDEAPQPPAADPDAALTAARARAEGLLAMAGAPDLRRLMHEGQQETSGRADDGGQGPEMELMVLRPGAPGCLATRILFTQAREPSIRPATRSRAEHRPGAADQVTHAPTGPEEVTGDVIVLLAAGTEHRGPADGPDRLIALARARAGRSQEPGGSDGDRFAAEFFHDEDEELLTEVSALAAASRPRGLAGLRERAWITAEELAERLGVPPGRVAEIESAAPADLDLPTLAAYVEALGGRLDLAADLGTERIPLG